MFLYIPRWFKLAASFCRDNDPHGGAFIIMRVGLEHVAVDMSDSLKQYACIFFDFMLYLFLYKDLFNRIIISFFNNFDDFLVFITENLSKAKILYGYIDFKSRDKHAVMLANFLEFFDLYYVIDTPTKEKMYLQYCS